MVRRKSQNASQIDNQVSQPVLRVQSGLYKSLIPMAHVLALLTKKDEQVQPLAPWLYLQLTRSLSLYSHLIRDNVSKSLY